MTTKKTQETAKYLVTAIDMPSIGMLTARVLLTEEESIKVSRVLNELSIDHMVDEVS
jgi:hypothetical protein